MSRIEAGAAVAHGRVYFGACNGMVFCADVDSGKQIWSYKTEPDSKGTHAIYCAPLVTDRTLYIAAMDGQLYALDATSGDERWVLRISQDSEIDSGSLATDGRRLFVATRAKLRKARRVRRVCDRRRVKAFPSRAGEGRSRMAEDSIGPVPAFLPRCQKKRLTRRQAVVTIDDIKSSWSAR